MNCRFAREMIALWVGNDLTQAEAEEVSKHVEGCCACQRHVEALLSSSDALDSYKAVTLSAERDSVWPRLESRLSDPVAFSLVEQAPQLARRALRSAAMTLVAVAAFAVALIPDYFQTGSSSGDVFSPVSVSGVSTGTVSRLSGNRTPSMSGVARVYPDPSWETLDALKHETASSRRLCRYGSL